MGDKAEKYTVGFAIVLLVIGDAWYCFQTARHAIAPTLATWLVFGIATTLSLVSYLKHEGGKKDVLGNIANRIDPAVCWIVVGFIAAFSPAATARFEPFDIRCLEAVAVILVLWAITRSALTANLLLQFVMTIAYVPMLQKMISEHRNHESFWGWGLNIASTMCFAIPPIRRRDSLGTVYIVRALVCSVIMMGLMIYFEFSGPG